MSPRDAREGMDEGEAMRITLRAFERDAAAATNRTAVAQRDYQAAVALERAAIASVEALRRVLRDKGVVPEIDHTNPLLPMRGDMNASEALDLIDFAFNASNGTLVLGEIKSAVAEKFPTLTEGDRLRRLLYGHPERGYKVEGLGRGAKWKKEVEAGAA